MVDSVFIDADYDGTAFDIDLADVLKKNADMLGEAVLVTLKSEAGDR